MKTCPKSIVAVFIAASPPALAHENGFLVHANFDTDGLEIGFEWDEAFQLDMQSPDLPGWSDELSFEEVLSDPNDEHYNPDWGGLTAGAKIRVVFDAFDIGLFAHDHEDHSIQYAAGDAAALGTGFTDFETPILWRLDPETPGYDPTLPFWRVRFHLIDAAGFHDPSPVYEFRVTPSPAGALVLAGGLVVVRRRRV